MNVLEGFGMLDRNKYLKYVEKMKAKGTPEEVAKNMKEIYADIIPTVFKSPFFKEIGKTLGNALANVFKEIAKIMKALLKGDYGTNSFLKAFYDAGGMDAINEILMYVAEGIGKLLLKIAEVYMGALAKAIGSGNFAAAGVLGALGLVFGAPAIAGIKIIASGMKMLVDAFKFLLANAAKIMPIKQVKVSDVGSVITDPSRMLPAAKTAGELPTSAINPQVVKGIGAFGKFMEYFRGVGPRFLTFFKGFFGKLAILGGVLTTVTSLFQGKDLATSLAEGAGPVLGAALGAALIPFLGPIGPMIGSLIGSWVGSLDAVTVPLTEIFRSVGGALQGLGDSLGMVVTVTGDLFGAVGQLIGSIFGVKGEFDGVKIALAPITLALQALELGLKGFALLLAEMRVFFKRYFGSSDEYQTAIKERDRLNASLKESQGRINAYNASMLGTVHLQKQVNDAQYELINGGKKLTNARKQELVAFIESAKRLNKNVQTKKDAITKPTTPGNLSAFQGTFNQPKRTTSPSLSQLLAFAPKPAKPGPPPPTSLSQLLASAPKPLPTAKPAAPVPVAPVLPKATPPGVGASTNVVPKEIAQTAANSQQLNQKATTQITQAAGIRAATQQTQKNTTTTNTLLGNIKSAMFAISNRMELLQSVIVQGLANVQSAITASGSLGGGMGGGFGGGIFGAGAGGQGVNKVIGIGNMLQSQGLTVAENSAFGSGRVGQHAPGSYHYSGRAIDVTGPTDKLNAAYAQLKGTNPAELLWQVPGHYDHLHVAYALGANNGKMFTNLSAARNWEQSMVPGSVKVASITGNSREGFGETSVVNNFTITQQPGEDGEVLANRVATLFYDAMNNAQSASIFG
jgi:hypothetical protein